MNEHIFINVSVMHVLHNVGVLAFIFDVPQNICVCARVCVCVYVRLYVPSTMDSD